MESYRVEEVLTKEVAAKIAELYIPYYKISVLTVDAFVARWQFAHSHSAYHMVALYQAGREDPIGFLDFSIIPSIFWAPMVGRIDSFFIMKEALQKPAVNALFEKALSMMQAHKISKIIAVSCLKYAEEIEALSQKMTLDDNSSKRFFIWIEEEA